MATEPWKVVPLPLLEGGSIEDTLSGFPSQIGVDRRLGRRVEREVSVVSAEIRGWHRVRNVLGTERARLLQRQTVRRVLDAESPFEPSEVWVEGEPSRPVFTVTFAGEQHGFHAVAAAQAMRDAAGSLLHPSMEERFGACVGVNSGTTVDTDLTRSGIGFRAGGTTWMFAARLQELAGPGQVLVSETTCRAVPVGLDVAPIGPVRTSPDGEALQAYSLLGLLARTAAR